MRTRFLLALLSVSAVSFGAKPPRVSYDAHSFKIDGKNTFLYSGAFHYFRCPEPLWAERFQKIKDAGFNTIETYCAWNDAEPEPPKDENDFSKVHLKELDDFLTMAIDRFGLNVIVRPGPYICSEWDMGGYPAWLMAKKPLHPTRSPWLRSDDPVYLTWARHWYRAVDKTIAKHQITRAKPGGKGVILYQIENEYDYAGGSDQVHLNQLHALADQARKDGIDIPLITCWTHQIRTTSDPLLKDVVDCPNFYPRWGVEGTKNSIREAHDQQPGKPVMITELQGGWFSEVGGLLAEDQNGISAAQERNLTLYCMSQGVTGTNYYMLFGGTNFGDRTPPNITTSYDYFAPIREDGEGGAKYEEVKAIGKFIAKYGDKLAVSSPDPTKVSTDDSAVELTVRKAPDGTRFVFLRNNSRAQDFVGLATVGEESFPYKLGGFESDVIVVPPGKSIKDGEWLPKAEPAPVSDAPRTYAKVTGAWTRADEPAEMKPAVLGDVAKDGIYDNRYVVYRSYLGAPPNAKLWLQLSGTEGAVVTLNGAVLQPTGRRHGAPLYAVPADSTPMALQVLYENPGRPNGGGGMEEDHGLSAAKLIVGALSDHPLTRWKIHNFNLDAARQYVQPGVDDSSWATVRLQNGRRQRQLDGYGTVAVFRTTVDVTQQEIDQGLTQLQCDGIDDEGWVYVNGQLVGENHQWDVPVEANVKTNLHAGENTIAIICRNFGGEGGVYEVPVLTGGNDDGPSLQWQMGQLAGNERHWERPGALAGWTPIPSFGVEVTTNPAGHGPDAGVVAVNRTLGGVDRKIASGSAHPGPGDKPTKDLMTWYRVDFDRPESTAEQALRVDALGNGFIWLNGRPLGRFWQVGPQREYFLPKCWLKPGSNTVTFQLRPVDGYATVRAVEVTEWGK